MIRKPQTLSQDDFMDDSFDDIFSMEESLMYATYVATLAEKFNLISFKPFQKE